MNADRKEVTPVLLQSLLESIEEGGGFFAGDAGLYVAGSVEDQEIRVVLGLEADELLPLLGVLGEDDEAGTLVGGEAAAYPGDDAPADEARDVFQFRELIQRAVRAGQVFVAERLPPCGCLFTGGASEGNDEERRFALHGISDHDALVG